MAGLGVDSVEQMRQLADLVINEPQWEAWLKAIGIVLVADKDGVLTAVERLTASNSTSFPLRGPRRIPPIKTVPSASAPVTQGSGAAFHIALINATSAVVMAAAPATVRKYEKQAPRGRRHRGARSETDAPPSLPAAIMVVPHPSI